MTKKRLFVYAAVVLAFVLACTAPSLSNMIAGALITYDPAEIGTATLEDEGDTVFVRMAEFTFGEGENEEKIVAPGFTVGDAANGDDPAANVDFDVLTPITKENRLTGELYKDIYVQNRDGEYTDLYLGDLTLYGKLYGSSGANLNLLGGSLTADTIETTGVISVVSADVTLREDLKGFRGLSLSASSEALNGDEANRPSTLTVWGSVENTLGVYYYEWSGTYDASIEVAHGSTLTVTDDISVVYPVVIHTTPGATQKSSLNVGGNLSVSKGYFGLTNARAKIDDNVNVKNDITLCDGSYLSADNVTGDSSLHVSKHSNFDIFDKITLGSYFDICYHDNAEEFKINGDLTCGTFTVIGKSDAAKITFTANGEINCNAFYVKYGVCDFNYDVKKTGSYQTFLLEYCDAKFNGNVSGPYFSMLESDVEINGDLKTLNGSSPIRNSTLKVNGDVESSSLNVLGSTVTINGELKNTSPLNVFKSFGKEGVLKVWGDITTNGVDVGIDAELTADSDLNSSSFVIVHQNSKLSVSGDAKSGSIFSVCSNSQAEISGDLEASASIGIHDHNSELTVDGSIKSNNLWFFAPCTVDGDVTGASSPIIVEDKLSVGGDIDCNGYFLQVNGAECEIGGDVKNNAGFGLSYGFKTVNGASYVVPARVKVNGDVDMGRTGGPNAFCVVGSECEIGGRITKAASFGVHAASVYTNGAYASYTSDVKVDGSVEGTDYGSYRFFTVEGSDCEIGGEVSNITTFGVFDYYCYGDDNIIGSNVKINDSVTAFGWACVDTNSKAVVTGDLTQNNQSGGLNGDLTVGGDYINLATAEGIFNKYNAGTFVSGKLTVKGDVMMNDLVLNYNDFEQNIDVAGTITANRKTDVIILPFEEDDPVPVYVIGGEEFPAPDPEDGAYIYSVPFYQQTVELTIDGEPYAMLVNDLNKKAFLPVKVSDKYSVTYVTGASAFTGPVDPVDFYYPELGLDLPAEEDLKVISGLLFGGWYDNADFEGDPITAIPVGATGDKTVYVKWIECDHAASTAQPTCTQTAVCTVCGLTIPTVDHTYGDTGAARYTCTVCGTVDETLKAAAEAADELAAAKADAKADLESYKNADDYRDAQKTELADAIAAGKAAIDAAEDTTAVDEALADAKAAIDQIKTDAELSADELAAAKASAEADLETYKNADDYRDAQKTELADAIAAGKAAIDAAEDTSAVAKALADAKAAIDKIKTDAELTEEEAAEITPDTPASEGPGVCEWCGETHDTSTIRGFIIDFMHDLLFILKQLTVGVVKFMIS